MTDLRPDLQSAWLGTMQQELGVNASNLMLKDLIIADLERRIVGDAALIEALQKRALDAEKGRQELLDRLENYERTPTRPRRKA